VCHALSCNGLGDQPDHHASRKVVGRDPRREDRASCGDERNARFATR
jgi:hypothetical protein